MARSVETGEPVSGRLLTRSPVPAFAPALLGALAALVLGAGVTLAGPRWGPLLGGASLLAFTFLVVVGRRPDLGMALFAFLIPLQARVNLPRDLSLAIGFLVISGLTLVAVYRELLPRVGKPPRDGNAHFLLPLTLFVGAALMSLWVAEELGEAARRGLYLAWFLALFWLTPRLVRGTETLVRVLRALSVATGIAAVIGLAQFALQFVVGALPLMWFWVEHVMPILEGERVAATHLQHGTNWILHVGGQPLMRAIGPFSGPPDAAQYLAIAVPLLTALTLQRPRLQWRDVACLSLAVLFLGASFSRQAWVGIFLGFLAMLLIGARGGRRRNAARDLLPRRLGLLLAIGSMAGALLVVAGSIQRDGPLGAVANRFQSILDPRDTSNQERFATWRSAFGLAEERPVLGAGLANYGVAVGDRRGAYSHNTYLDVLVEIGPLGLLGLLLLLGWAFSAAARIARGARDGEVRAFGMGAAGAIVAIAVIFFFDDAFFFPRAGQAFWLLLGLIVAAERLEP